MHDTEKVKNAFQLVTPSKTHLYIAKNPGAKLEWVVAINDAIARWLEQNPSYKRFRSFARLKMRQKCGIWKYLSHDVWSDIASAQALKADEVI